MSDFQTIEELARKAGQRDRTLDKLYQTRYHLIERNLEQEKSLFKLINLIINSLEQ